MHIPLYEKVMRLPAIKRHSLLSFIFTVAVTVAGFISTIFFSNMLGKDLMGVYYLFIAYYYVFNLVGDGGFGGAAVGSLIAIFVNMVIVVVQLKRFMPVYVEKRPVLNIVIASGVMGLLIFAYKVVVPLDNIVLTLVPVVLGVLIYVCVLFKLDKGIRDDAVGILANFGLIR